MAAMTDTGENLSPEEIDHQQIGVTEVSYEDDNNNDGAEDDSATMSVDVVTTTTAAASSSLKSTPLSNPTTTNNTIGEDGLMVVPTTTTTTATIDNSVCVDFIPDCAICLQACIYPVQLPCTHIFCFLCIKGVAIQSKRCALCRQEIPVEFLDSPRLVVVLQKPTTIPSVPESVATTTTTTTDDRLWYYEGRNGWWRYDERTSHELEDAYIQSKPYIELLIAGFLYIIDLNNMVQMRRHDPNRRRRVKRDCETIPNKGVAGIRADTLKLIQSTQDHTVVSITALPVGGLDAAGCEGGDLTMNPSNKGVVKHKTKSLFTRKSNTRPAVDNDSSTQLEGSGDSDTSSDGGRLSGGSNGSKMKLSKIPSLFGFGSKQKTLKCDMSTCSESPPQDGATANIVDQLTDLSLVGDTSTDRTQSHHDQL